MEAEALNIKIRLDASGVTSGIKKVKQELGGVKKSVKDSMPQIAKEGDKAEKSLNEVDKATDKLKKSLSDIGTKAKESLGKIYTEGSKVADKLKNVKMNVGANFDSESFSEGAGAASDSIQELQNTMSQMRTLDFANFISNNFDRIKNAAGKATGGVKKFVSQIKETFKDLEVDIALQTGKTFHYLRKNLSNLKNSLASATKAVISFATSLTAMIGATVGLGAIAGIGAGIANNTRQYREEQTKLNTAFQAAGASAEEASQAYNGLFRFLGQSDRSVEAANHLAKITTNTRNLAEWTTICQGIYATFGDSLPIEGLTEAANETLRVGKVTGVMADALNWAGVSEDAMNATLEKTTNLEERERILRSTLNGLYQNAAQIYEENNKRIIEQNEAQSRLNATMARIGQQTQILVTSWINLKNALMNILAPAIIYVSAAFSVLIDKLVSAIKWLGALLGINFTADKIGGIVSGVGTSINDATGATDGLTDSLNKATGAAQKLKRQTMGFDELNVLSNPDTASGGADVGAGADIGAIKEFEAGNGILSGMGEKIEDIKAKIEGFFDKWKTQIGIIGGALGAITIAGLLGSLGKAIGLGDKFLGVIGKIKQIAATAITIVLQYTLVNEFMDKYINGEGFKEYIKGLLVSALGTWVLYSMWGPTGLVLGLGVTAVASIKSVIDNGGITNTESAVVALTGLASAIGAVTLAAKTFNLGAIIGEVGAFFGLLKEGNKLVPALSVAFPKLGSAISSIGYYFGVVGTAVKGALAAIGGLVGGGVASGLAIVAAAVAAVVSVVVFLKNNWEAVTNTVKRFFEENIAPKLDKIKEAFKKMGDALGKLIPPGLKKLISDIATAIGNVVKQIAEWFKSVEWIKAIGKVFEVIGGIIFGAVSGVIAGAIEALVGYIQGAVDVISGVVQIVSGVIRAIVKLFTGDLQGAGKACKDIANGIVDTFKGLYNVTIGVVVNFVKGIIDWFVKLWDELVGHSIVPDMVKAIIEWFAKLPEKILAPLKNFVNKVLETFKKLWSDTKAWFQSNVSKFFTKEYWNGKFDTIRASANDKLTAVKNAISNKWGEVKNFFTSNIAPKFTREYWNSKFDTIKSSASSKLEEVKSTISSKWNNLKSWFNSNISPKFTVSFWTGKFNAIKDGAKAAFNGIISVVEQAINGIIRKINTLSWKIPDWVPKFGGDRFGFNFKTISIPRLADGGIAYRSTIANIGEAGKEAVLPLDRNTQWMDALADRIASRNSAPSKIVLNVDGKTFAETSIKSINDLTRATGSLQLRLV